MKKSLQSLVLLLVALMVPATATAAYEQLAEGVYQDGSTLYICSGVTSLGDLQINPSEIFCYATIPPACMSNTFTGYDAVLHVPAAGMVSYFTTLYWYNFNNILSDAIEPMSITMNAADAELEIGQQLSLSATVAPGDATPKTVYWSSTDASVASVSAGGEVTALSTGECDILATCVDKVAVCHVIVVNPRVTISLDKHEARLLPNHTTTLTATCSPIDVDLAVTTSNPGVAIPRLVNGTIMVVGVAEGSATITVNATDGWGHPDSCVVTVYTELGDVNCDGYVNISDVTDLIDFLLSGNVDSVSQTNADCDKDGKVNIADVTTLIDFLLGGNWPWEPEEPVTQTFTVNGVTFKMMVVDGGTFMMGASDDDGDAYDNEKPAHQVTLSSYCIGETEVTQALWLAVMGGNPSWFAPRKNYDENLQRPVESVSWNDCQKFINKLNEITGKQFRLPSEAEWEFAARGGNLSKGYMYSGSNDINEVDWCWDNIPSQTSGDASFGTQPVATKLPNELGLYDMGGNVIELCQDGYSIYSSDAQMNPAGTIVESDCVCRGGSYRHNATRCRVTNRFSLSTSSVGSTVGLRLAIDLENSSKFRLSKTIVTVDLGQSTAVRILNGHDSYTVAGGAECVTSVINENILYVAGTVAGTTTVHVNDVITGETTILTVIVNDPSMSTFSVGGVSFKMISVTGGTFTMGATSEQDGYAFGSEYPVHQVTLSSFMIGQTEVTQELWQVVMGDNPSYFKPGNGYGWIGQRPVERVSWDDCQEFIVRLNYITGCTFRLPTEAEWEYAARGGNKSQGYTFAGSDIVGDVAWYSVNAGVDGYDYNYVTHIVATKNANELELYDMSGNVKEWVQDWYGNYQNYSETNPTGPASGYLRVQRGGDYSESQYYCRVSSRNCEYPMAGDNRTGLRLAL